MCGDLERERGGSLDASRTGPVCRCFRGASSALISLVLCLLWISGAPCALCVEAATNGISALKDLAYKPAAPSDYETERCKLDLYLPEGEAGFPILVWFHGGALKEGSKDDAFTVRIARSLAKAGLAVATVNYRLSPKAKYPSYVEDAAAAFAWVHGHIGEHGGDPKRVFIGGHSAGGYLTLMVGLDPRYLRQLGIDTTAIAGLIPMSGQTMTHYTIRDERGLDHNTIIADEAAPIHYVRKDAPPMLVLYADHDMPARAEENQYLVAALKAAGDTRVTGLVIRDRDHGSIAGNIAQPGDPTAQAIFSFTGARVRAMVPSQSRGEGAGADGTGLQDATILIIRHAEKPEAGPGLSPAGKRHAKAYVDYFRTFRIDSQPVRIDCLIAAADSANSHRPRLTLTPLSRALGLKINLDYADHQVIALADALRSQANGKCLLICWRHGAIPDLLSALGANPAGLLPDGKWPDDEFGWVLQLRSDHHGRLIPGETRRIVQHLAPRSAN